MTSTIIIQQMNKIKKEKDNAKKGKEKTKKEHYVPRFYLEKFSNLSLSGKERQIWIFNKQSQKAPYQDNIKSTAAERYFYDFPVDLVGEENKKEFDKVLQKIEDKIAPFYKRIEKRISYILKLNNNHKHKARVIKKSEKKHWACILATQALRTPEFRNLLKEIKQKASNENIIQEILDQGSRDQAKQIQTDNPQLNPKTIENIQKLLVGLVSEVINILYSELMPITHYDFFQNYFDELSKNFTRCKYLIGVNQSKIPFYTSDHPVVTIPYLGTGYSSERIEILYPINSQLILILRDKKHPKSNEGDCKLINLNEEEVTSYNKAQVYSSNRFIYCKENRFDLAQLLCQENPDIYSKMGNKIKFMNEESK